MIIVSASPGRDKTCGEVKADCGIAFPDLQVKFPRAMTVRFINEGIEQGLANSASLCVGSNCQQQQFGLVLNSPDQRKSCRRIFALCNGQRDAVHWQYSGAL